MSQETPDSPTLNLIEHLPYLLLVVNKDGEVVFANEKMKTFLGYSSQDTLVGQRHGDILRCRHRCEHPSGCGHSEFCQSYCQLNSAIVCSFNRWLPMGTAVLEILHENDTEKYFSLKTVPMLQNEQKFLVLCLEDIGPQKKADAYKLINERLQGAIEMSGTICHEINQPLQVIAGYTSILAKENTSSKNKKILNIIDDQIKRLSTITSKLNAVVSYKTRHYAEQRHIIDLERSTVEEIN